VTNHNLTNHNLTNSKLTSHKVDSSKVDTSKVDHPTSSNLEQEAQAILNEACEQYPLGYKPTIEWRGLRVTAGVAYYQLGKIALSKHVLQSSEQLRETLLHEYAHLLAFQRAGRRGAGHGVHWRKAMTDLGLPPKVTHKYEVKRNQSHQEVVYQCRKCKALITRKRRLNKRRRYLHLNCGGTIELKSIGSAMECVKPS
jgi:predicted SprT family Zn-dependent metalloprotease